MSLSLMFLIGCAWGIVMALMPNLATLLVGLLVLVLAVAGITNPHLVPDPPSWSRWLLQFGVFTLGNLVGAAWGEAIRKHWGGRRC